ncbi:MAG: SDR family NAD(P)-dependent oxidoreductase [Bacteroidia bacterium]
MANILNTKILITGGAGFIGCNLARHFVTKGYEVVVLDNFSTGFKHNIADLLPLINFKLIEGDITDYDTCLKATEGATYVLHHAALGSVTRSIAFPLATNKVNVDGFLNVMQACVANKVQRLVYASSSSVYGSDTTMPKVEHITGNLLSPYAATKKANEMYADVFSRTYNLETIGLRYFNVFGDYQNPLGQYAAVIPLFIQSVLKNESPTIFGDGENTRDFTYVQNVVQANVCAIETDMSAQQAIVCNVAYGSTISINDLFKTIAKILNVTNIQPTYHAPRKGDIKDSYANISLAKKLLNYSSIINVEDGLKRAVAFYQSHKIQY